MTGDALPPPERLAIDTGWMLTRADDRPDGAGRDGPYPATVPGCVHTDLLAAGVIDDPFLDRNELDVAWVADADWRYAAELPAPTATHDRVELAFAGLDTLAELTIAGAEIGRTGNMHRSYRFELTSLIGDRGGGELAVTFRSATREAERRRAEFGDWPSSSFGRPFNYVRKMACSWGWDWGPWLTTAGIWRPATLHAWSVARLASVRPEITIDATDRGLVVVRAAVERARGGPLVLRATLTDDDGDTVATATQQLGAGDVAAAIVLSPGTVARWWPAGQGDQSRYQLDVQLLADDGDGTDETLPLDGWSRRIGFRSIILETTPDATGAAFTLVVNDRPMFARGVNWIPDDVFPTRVTADRYRDRLQQARDADIDLVRVWGGGIYEDDTFYDACDELGLLVWQDFTFACAAYPEHLLADEVAAEAAENVERLMPHPSLALWNGNNENLWGHEDWGWREVLGDREWGAGFYLDVLPEIVAAVDPTRPYWAGSPYSGTPEVHPNADAHGCIHEWEVWNRLDYARYRDRTPRFASEFGWQAPPTWSTLRASVTDDPLTPTSPGMLHHQKADGGNDKLERGLATHFDRPDELDAWLWATQLNQARAVRAGVEHFRSLHGWCMGTIWWQLNDCWPVTSWAVVDGGGRRKPAWYALRDAYARRLLTIQPRGDELVLFAVNDSEADWTAAVTVERLAFDGSAGAEDGVELAIQARSATSWTIPHAVARPADPTGELLRAAAAGAAPGWWWFARDKVLPYPAQRLSLEHVAVLDDATVRIDVRAGGLARDLTLLADRIDPSLEVDRQLVTLLPGESASFVVTGDRAAAAAFSPGDTLAPPHWWTANDLRSAP